MFEWVQLYREEDTGDSLFNDVCINYSWRENKFKKMKSTSVLTWLASNPLDAKIVRRNEKKKNCK